MFYCIYFYNFICLAFQYNYHTILHNSIATKSSDNIKAFLSKILLLLTFYHII